jgi:hypothetical protein
MTSIEKAVDKASELLLKREDENEYHLHDVDRKWVIEAMMDYAEYVLSGMSEKPNNHTNSEIPNVCSSQTEISDNSPKEENKTSYGEISDEEIEKSANYYYLISGQWDKFPD